jgi:hypothetical protein
MYNFDSFIFGNKTLIYGNFKIDKRVSLSRLINKMQRVNAYTFNDSEWW